MSFMPTTWRSDSVENFLNLWCPRGIILRQPVSDATRLGAGVELVAVTGVENVGSWPVRYGAVCGSWPTHVVTDSQRVGRRRRANQLELYKCEMSAIFVPANIRNRSFDRNSFENVLVISRYWSNFSNIVF